MPKKSRSEMGPRFYVNLPSRCQTLIDQYREREGKGGEVHLLSNRAVVEGGLELLNAVKSGEKALVDGKDWKRTTLDASKWRGVKEFLESIGIRLHSFGDGDFFVPSINRDMLAEYLRGVSEITEEPEEMGGT